MKAQRRRREINQVRLTKQFPDLVKAHERIGGTTERQARWLLEFAARDLSQLSAGAWLKVQWEVTCFLLSDVPRDLAPSWDVPVPERRVLECQTLLSEGLETLAQNRRWFYTPAIQHHLVMNGGKLRCFSSLWHRANESYFFNRIYETLKVEQHRFRFCLKCRRPFIARKRQTYCTSRCSQTVRTRKYRAVHRDRLRDLRHQTYERKIRAKVGPKVKVGRRSAASRTRGQIPR